MAVISGNITLMARAAQMVLTCNPSSDATPAGNANSSASAATGALAANNSASAGLATDGALAGTIRACRGYCRGLNAAESVCALGVKHGPGDCDRGHHCQPAASAVG